jgi:L-amino acid N-acyltransferase YncA
MPTYIHRLARPDDLRVIVDIYNSTVASREVTADTEPVSVASRQVWFDEHQPDRRPLWVVAEASAPDTVIGWISFSNFYGRPAYAGTAEVSIYIDEAWRGKGIGRYCLEEAIAFAPAIRVHTLLGFIFGHNAPSLGLFRKFGFDTWANLPRVANLDGVERDLIILGKRIG